MIARLERRLTAMETPSVPASSSIAAPAPQPVVFPISQPQITPAAAAKTTERGGTLSGPMGTTRIVNLAGELVVDEATPPKPGPGDSGSARRGRRSQPPPTGHGSTTTPHPIPGCPRGPPPYAMPTQHEHVFTLDACQRPSPTPTGGAPTPRRPTVCRIRRFDGSSTRRLEQPDLG